MAPAATVDRVKQAESEFSTVQRGITDGTPLSQASQQFNSAAVALEMSWLRLFSDAGCLTDEQQKQAEAAVRDYTTALQKSLRDAGYYDGEVDGVYGPATVDAVEALQQAHGLPTTGTVDKATAAALQSDLVAKGGVIAQEAVASTAAVQQTLTARRILERSGRRRVDTRADRGPEGLPDRARCGGDRHRRRGDHRRAREGDRRGEARTVPVDDELEPRSHVIALGHEHVEPDDPASASVRETRWRPGD